MWAAVSQSGTTVTGHRQTPTCIPANYRASSPSPCFSCVWRRTPPSPSARLAAASPDSARRTAPLQPPRLQAPDSTPHVHTSIPAARLRRRALKAACVAQEQRSTPVSRCRRRSAQVPSSRLIPSRLCMYATTTYSMSSAYLPTSGSARARPPSVATLPHPASRSPHLSPPPTPRKTTVLSRLRPAPARAYRTYASYLHRVHIYLPTSNAASVPRLGCVCSHPTPPRIRVPRPCAAPLPFLARHATPATAIPNPRRSAYKTPLCRAQHRPQIRGVRLGAGVEPATEAPDFAQDGPAGPAAPRSLQFSLMHRSFSATSVCLASSSKLLVYQ
ncbi:hypothetical protein B0H15DRAFT_65861 [Mycena belliarum]|uniref:Uncharacterized protein n=1 Tax=Mycena belliarum TaxID=1033014 RepID=A0AAD6TSJ2_9AGAR|nr:hypothetical protein B0H15DRAFT_65861 [Mycena belliae]